MSPLYEYECPVCKEEDRPRRFEVKHGKNDNVLVVCKLCTHVAKRVISAIPHYWKSGVPN